ncbi:hypothetical protein [Microvirga puerhi]|uniref:Uncharacterized protein n=1 Tax=Microvirga puerhi TaxID=2876078 RepID=A0ABS7VU32_9HYPH|nr:hypothetical protein [Microvirga puerhi]MBZ6079086.1 hypothetical protein [Microvirga puerhi]
MPTAERKSNAMDIGDIAQVLSQIVDVAISPQRAEELIDEMSQLMWAISDLGPDAKDTLGRSNGVTDLAT